MLKSWQKRVQKDALAVLSNATVESEVLHCGCNSTQCESHMMCVLFLPVLEVLWVCQGAICLASLLLVPHQWRYSVPKRLPPPSPWDRARHPAPPDPPWDRKAQTQGWDFFLLQLVQNTSTDDNQLFYFLKQVSVFATGVHISTVVFTKENTRH